jgi:hypothetical protein
MPFLTLCNIISVHIIIEVTNQKRIKVGCGAEIGLNVKTTFRHVSIQFHLKQTVLSINN